MTQTDLKSGVAQGASASSNGVDSATMHAAIRAAQIQLLYRTPPIMLINLVNAPITAAVLWQFYPAWALLVWVGLFCIVIPLRLLDRRRYLRLAAPAADTDRWARRFTIGTIATGCLWGLAGSVVLVTPDIEYHVFVAFVLGGMTAGAIVTEAAYLPAFIAFLVPTIIPIIVAMVASANPMSIGMGTMTAAFASVLAGVGRTINRWIADTTRLQINQTMLTQNLQTASSELHRRDHILNAMAGGATELLRTFDLNRSVPMVLKLVGESTSVSRAYLFQHVAGPNGRFRVSKRYEWSAPAITPARDNPELQNLDLEATGLVRWAPDMARGNPQTGITRLLDSPTREFLTSLDVKSILLVPVFVAGRWWGEIGFDDCREERHWSTTEIDTLKTVAEFVGTAIAHADDVRELTAAAHIIEHSSTIVYRIDPKPPFAITYVSQNVKRYGYTVEQFLSDPTLYIEVTHPDDRSKVLVDLGRVAEGTTNEVVGEYRVRRPDGSYVWFEGRTRAVYDDDRRLTAIEGLLTDIDERKLAEAEMSRFVQTDQLTGLANRIGFMNTLTHTFMLARWSGAPFAVLYLDIDHFKDVNDVLGHSKGDELLKAVAERLNRTRRAGDMVARFGGDEFAILLTEVSDPSVAGAFAARILQVIAAPFDIGTEIHVTASIGIAVYSRDIAQPEDMIKQVDLALYRAKDAGRNQYHFHSDQLDVEVRERVTLGDELRLAIERHELELHYQPQVELSTGKIVGLEALMRWNHPSRGFIHPTRFVPIAEKTGLIVALGRWAIDEVCQQIRRWREERITLPVIAINMSAVQLNAAPEFDRELAETLKKWGIDPRAIELELTESVLMQTTREHGELMDRLRALGVSIAIDDFGTGYSSLEYLRSYHVSHLKIAQQFIQDLETDPGDVAIVRASLSLARELGIKAIAEGVQNKAQLDLLAEAGCHYVQGFYFSRPVRAEEVGGLLRRRKLEPEHLREGAGNAKAEPAPSIAPSMTDPMSGGGLS